MDVSLHEWFGHDADRRSNVRHNATLLILYLLGIQAFCSLMSAFFKGQVASISSMSATIFFFLLLKVEQQPTHPFHLDWHQYAHILRNLSRVGRKTSHREASQRKNEPFRRLLLVAADSLRLRPDPFKIPATYLYKILWQSFIHNSF